ncbi:hypothetical protein P7C70_g4628, partial [Phenoliferia sp. Uapishka_3]
MFTISPPSIDARDVSGSVVVARYTYQMCLNRSNLWPRKFGPYNSSININPKATHCYTFKAPKLAALLTRFQDVFRSQLSKLRAPVIDITSTASYTSAIQCIKGRSALPQEWVLFQSEVLAHLHDITWAHRDHGVPGERLFLECVMTRKLFQELRTVEDSWKSFSKAVAVWEQETAQSYFTQARSWITGLVSKAAPPVTVTAKLLEASPTLAPSSFVSKQSAIISGATTICVNPTSAASTAAAPAELPTATQSPGSAVGPSKSAVEAPVVPATSRTPPFSLHPSPSHGTYAQASRPSTSRMSLTSNTSSDSSGSFRSLSSSYRSISSIHTISSCSSLSIKSSNSNNSTNCPRLSANAPVPFMTKLSAHPSTPTSAQLTSCDATSPHITLDYTIRPKNAPGAPAKRRSWSDVLKTYMSPEMSAAESAAHNDCCTFSLSL